MPNIMKHLTKLHFTYQRAKLKDRQIRSCFDTLPKQLQNIWTIYQSTNTQTCIHYTVTVSV